MNILSIAMLAGFQKQLNSHKFLLFSLGFICTSAIHPLGIWKTYRSGFPCFAEENWALLCVFIHSLYGCWTVLVANGPCVICGRCEVNVCIFVCPLSHSCVGLALDCMVFGCAGREKFEDKRRIHCKSKGNLSQASFPPCSTSTANNIHPSLPPQPIPSGSRPKPNRTQSNPSPIVYRCCSPPPPRSPLPDGVHPRERVAAAPSSCCVRPWPCIYKIPK